jgi:hypothetical protein
MPILGIGKTKARLEVIPIYIVESTRFQKRDRAMDRLWDLVVSKAVIRFINNWYDANPNGRLDHTVLRARCDAALIRAKRRITKFPGE